MNTQTDHKIILVTRPTRLAELVARFNTVSQARFYIEHQGADFSDYQLEDEIYHQALVETQDILGQFGRIQLLHRSFLPNFVFGPKDFVVTLGQDGLVANTLKYLDGQPVIGVNPDPKRWDGRLLPFQVRDLKKVMKEVLSHKRSTCSISMAKATMNNGQTLYGVNDLFCGPKTHGSARYVLHWGNMSESQSSSGIIISTGLGSSGWLRSLISGATAIARSASSVLDLRSPTVRQSAPIKSSSNAMDDNILQTEFAWNAQHLVFTVREPFPSRTTGTSVVLGRITRNSPLRLESHIAENGVIFSDGLEQDFLEFNSGSQAVINLAEKQGILVV